MLAGTKTVIHAAAADRQLAEIQRLIVGLEKYLDSVDLFTTRKFTQVEQDTITRLSRKRPFPRKTKAALNPAVDWEERECLTGPTDDVYRYILDRGIAHEVARCDVSLDLIMPGMRSVMMAHPFVAARWVAPGRRKVRPPARDFDTLYDAPVGSPLVLASYPQTHDRHTGRPVLHLDWRVTGVKPLRRLGIRTVADLLNLDVLALWRDALVFEEVDQTDLFRLWRTVLGRDRRLKKLYPDYDRHRAGYGLLLWMHATLYDRLDVWMPAKAVRDAAIQWPEFEPLKCALRRLDTSRLLDPGNVVSRPDANSSKYALVDQALRFSANHAHAAFNQP